MSDLALVGVTGKKRHGKDSVAQRLIERHDFVRIGFADALKELALELDPIIHGYDDYAIPLMDGDERLADIVFREGWEQAKEVPEIRRILQALGVGVREHVGADTWVNIVKRKVLTSSERIVVPDVRFPNEIETIRQLGGYVIRVVRPGMSTEDQHVSETALDGYEVDVELTNNRDLDHLHALTDEAIGLITDKHDVQLAQLP